MLTFCEWLEATPIGVFVREGENAFTVLVALHILALAFSVGVLLWFDLRLLGLTLTGVRVSDVYRRLIPWATMGFVVMFVTGTMLGIGYATSAYASPYFRLKMAAIALAGVNAAWYHVVTTRTAASWDIHAPPPLAARMAGAVSLALWTTVIVAGRLLSYTMF